MAEASGGGGLEQVVGTCSQCDGSASTFLPDGVCSNCSGQPIATGTHSPAATRSHSVIGNSAIGGHGIDPASLSGAEGGDASSNKRGRIANGKDSATEERNSGGEGNGGRGKKTPGDEAGAADGETNTLPNNKELKVLASTEEAEVEVGMEETQTEKVERMIIEEITVPLIKTRNYFQCEGINFEEDEVLILLCIKPDGLFQVRRCNGQQCCISKEFVKEIEPLMIERKVDVDVHEIHRYVEEGEHDEEVVFPVVITTTGYQDQNITFDNHEHLILLYRTENNSSVRRWNGQEGCIPNDRLTEAEPLNGVMKVKRTEKVPPVMVEASNNTTANQNKEVPFFSRVKFKAQSTWSTAKDALSAITKSKGISTQGDVLALPAQFESNDTSTFEAVVIPLPLIDASGFIEDPQKGLTLHINVLVPVDMWNFNRENSEVFLCFGHPKLGEWNPIMKLNFMRSADSNLLQFALKVIIDAAIIKNHEYIEYKYYVLSGEKSDECFEYIGYYYTGPNIKRCLLIPTGNTHGVSFDQYDGIIYPRVCVKSEWKSKPVHDVLQKMSLPVYLKPLTEELLKCSVIDVAKTASSMMCIFYQLVSTRVCTTTKVQNFESPSVQKAMKDLLLATLRQLKELQCSSAHENGMRIVSVLTVILCFCHLIPQHIEMSNIANEDIALLLSMLKLNLDEEKKRCVDYEHVNRCMCSIDQQVKKSLTETVLQFCNELHHRTQFNHLEWLYAVPLLHFLQGVSRPFDKIELDADKIQWGDKNLGLSDLKSQEYDGDMRLIDDHYDTLRPFLSADPKLLPVLLYICPKKQLPVLFQHIPLYVSVAWLIEFLRLRPVFELHDLASEVLQCLKNHKLHFEKTELMAVVTSSKKLLSNVTKKLFITRIDESCHELGVVVSLALYAAHFLKQCAGLRSSVQKCNENMKKICICVSTWISEKIKSPFHITMQDQTSYQMDEMKFWNQMLNLDCPQSETQLWHKLIAAALQERLNKMRPMYKINLIIMLGEYKDAHHILEEIFITAVEERLMSFDDRIEILRSELEKINRCTTNKALIAVILMKILKRQYPTGVDASTQTALLSCGIWPTYLKIHSSFPYEHQNLKYTYPQSDEKELYMACTHVVEVVRCVYSSVISGAVTIKELQELETQKKHLCKLFVASCSEECTEDQTKRDLITAIEEQKAQYNKLTGKARQLKSILSNVSQYMEIERGERILERLSTNFADVHINILCSKDDVEHSLVPLLAETAPLNPIINGYMCLAHSFPTEMFKHIWLDKIEELHQIEKTTLSLEEIPTKLWDPVVEKCVDLLTTLQQCTITLAVVDEYFSKYKRYKNAALNDMFRLYQDLCSFHEKFLKNIKDEQKIQKAVHLIEEYWSLRSYAQAATICLDMKKELQLEGDFANVEKLAKHDISSLKEQSLRDLENTLIKTGKFLQKFAAKDKISSLQIYCSCSDIVSWLQSNIKDVTGLQGFVSVALNNATTGEDTLTNEKLSALRTVGSGFGCLIYDLPKEAGFEVLKQQCVLLWENMITTPKLPQCLNNCNKEVEWFNLVMAQQGSVKETSFGQLDACIKHGMFRVGQKGADIFHNMSDIVKLTVDSKHGRVYHLDDLKDLESKLVLITGNKDERRIAMDGFLDIFHSICEIAEVLMVLQQVGNVKYIGWYITVPCSPELIPELRKLHSLMQRELEEWRRAVRCSRKYHYELNYFTTPQLLTLRQALVLSASSLSHSIELKVLALLHSLSPHISVQSVKDAVKSEREKRESVKISQSVTNETYSVFQPKAEVKKQSKAKSHKLVNTSSKDAEISEHLSPEEVKKGKIVANIVQKYGEKYEKLVIQAVNGGQTDEIEIENIVLDNQGSESDSTNDEQDYWEEDDEGETDLSSEDETLQQSNDMPQSQSGCSEVFEKEALHMTIKKAVDSSHPGVQELIDAGYSKEDSILAFEVCGTAEGAVEYLITKRAGGAIDNHARASKYTEHSEAERLLQVTCYCKEEQNYLTLDQLGNVLKDLSSSHLGAVQQVRTFQSRLLNVGKPNLLLVPPDQVLKTALSLYMEDKSLPLPTFEEILICTPTTTTEEVELLWRRAVEDPRMYRIFCLVHAENLSYHTSDQALQCLHDATQGKTSYRLVIICSSDKKDSSLIVSKLKHLRVPYLPPQDRTQYKKYLDAHFKNEQLNALSSSVRVVSSARAGMGKSFYIHNMANELSKMQHMSAVTVTVPIHGPKLSVEALVDKLEDYMDNPHCVIHLDIASTVLWQLDTTLFSMMLQGGLSDSQGRVWRRHPSQMYAIEVTQTAKEVKLKEKNGRIFAILDILPLVQCVKPQDCLSFLKEDTVDPSLVLMNETLFKSSQYQMVYQYLRRYRHKQNLDIFTYRESSVEGTIFDCLQCILSHCGIKDPTWAEIGHFVNFLAIQLHQCEKSIFCKPDIIGDVLTGFKTFVVKFMIQMSRDFATSSLKGEIAEDDDEAAGIQRYTDVSDLEQYQIHQRKQWEQNSHPYLFFNRDEMSLTFVGFLVSQAGDLIDDNRTVIERGLMTPQLQAALNDQNVNFEDNYQTWSKQKMVQKIATVMGLTLVQDPDKSYVLTVDNLLKILAIQMRFRCGIPVVVMGETGCGKTRLIRFMCDLVAQSSGRKNLFILKVHGGITEADVATFISCAEKHVVENQTYELDTVVFFDEANTTDAIGLISEIMCDRTMHGKEISKELKFIAACNPYRRHTDEMVKKLETAGLGFFVQAEEIKQKLGTIPLRNLVYRVQDLPPRMKPLVYDFGQLNSSKERQYVIQIVSDHVQKHSDLSNCPGTVEAVAKVLSWSQEYMRMTKDECSFVSLRDVKRAMIVFEYFYIKMKLFSHLMYNAKANELEVPVGETEIYLTRSLVLALSVCYHARLQERKEFELGVVKQFYDPLKLPGGVIQFKTEIKKCQEVLLDNMQLGKNIARNAALRENVFMMAICIDLRIPLFLVGKPGSSKSLAKSIVSNSISGRGSKTELLKSFKQVSMFSYQCSQLSTSESIIKVFDTAKSFQKEDTVTFVSVVVLDEVGLAEDSPNMPLKALHPLLEDGTAGSDKHKNEEKDELEERVAFIGISNWALDPAKMNRGVMVTRGDPDVKELELSARGICSTREQDPVRDHLAPYFRPLAEAYFAICAKQKRQFYGLRDFYSLIKMLYWMCESSGIPPSGQQLCHAIMRNFGGMQEFDPYFEFQNRLSDILSKAEHPIIDCSPRELIIASLQTKETSWHGENRYLLLLTENYAALEVLKSCIHERQPTNIVQGPLQNRNPLIAGPELSSPEVSSKHELEAWKMDPFILFGSSFPKDKEYTQVCRNINQIKICMETGRMVVLLNLHHLYESLYDLLNQYYITFGEERYVDLGLQTHRLKCKVHKEFKLIMIAEKDTVYDKFPTPLINRLEKHFVLVSSVLSGKETEVMNKLKNWVKRFTNICKFSEQDAFTGYQEDTTAAVVSQANRQLQRLLENRESVEWTRFQEIDDKVHSSNDYFERVFKLSQYLLLCTASPAALVRLLNTDMASHFSHLCKMYKSQHHSSISDFLHYQLHFSESNPKFDLLMQVTTHSHLLSHDEVKEVQDTLQFKDGNILSFLLQDFDTELHFTSKIGPLFKTSRDSTPCKLIIIQCDMGYIADDLIACARNRVYDMRAKAAREFKSHKNVDPNAGHTVAEDVVLGTHVLFILYLSVQTLHSSLVGFQGDTWISAHIDDIRPSSDSIFPLNIAQGTSIGKLFYGPLEDDELSEYIDPLLLLEHSADCGPNVQQMNIVSGPNTQVLSPGPNSQVLASASGPTTHIVFPSGAGPAGQVIPTINSSPSQQLISSVPSLVKQREEEMAQAAPKPANIPQRQHKIIHRMYTQCRRLHVCIQAAASRLVHLTPNKKWATKRVEWLTDLIPHEPTFPIDETSFYGILVKHIHCLLKQRGHMYGRNSNWVLNEAMNLRKLHIGGTFRNALSRKLDNIVIPLFAELIAVVDHNYNLRHLKHLSIDETPVQELWLRMFSDAKVLQLNYADIVGREKVPIIDDNFECQLPFSWLIKAAIDGYLEKAKNTCYNVGDIYHQLCSVFPESPIGEALSYFDYHHSSNDLIQRYVKDFLRMTHKCKHSDKKYVEKEYKLLYNTLMNLAEKSSFVKQNGHISPSDEDAPADDGQKTLTSKIVAVHVVYHSVEQHIHWFGQITFRRPGMLEVLEANSQNSPNINMNLHLQALQQILLFLDYKPDRSEDTLKQWLNHISVFRNTIESILSMPSEDPLATNGRIQWQRIQVLQIFADTVMFKMDVAIPYKELSQFANRLRLFMRKKDPDFLKSATLDWLKRFLGDIIAECREDKSKPKKTVHALKKCCDVFLIKVVSSLCFSQQSAPEDELIQKLLDLIFTETSQEEGSVKITTRELACKPKKDETPIIRSFMLQMLLTHNFDQVRKHLKDFLDRSKRSLSTGLNQDLCFMYTQCLEDALVKCCVPMPPEEKMVTCAKFLSSGASYLNQVDTNISLEQLESIANIRFALAVAADLLHRQPDISIVVDSVPQIVSQLNKHSITQNIVEGREYEEEIRYEQEKVGDSKLESDTLLLASTTEPAPSNSLSTEPIPLEHLHTERLSSKYVFNELETLQLIAGAGKLLPARLLSIESQPSRPLPSEVLSPEVLPPGTLHTELPPTSLLHAKLDPASQLLLAAQSICKKSGPGNYLLKLIVRQYGFSFLRRLIKTHPWVVPSSLMWTEEEEKSLDPYVIHGHEYILLRKALGSVAYADQQKDLMDVTKGMQSQGTALLSLGLHQVIATSKTSQSSTEAISLENLQEMDKYFQNSKFLSKEMKLLAKRLVANEQGGPLAALKTARDTPIELQIIGRVVVHAVTVLLSQNKADILLPFHYMLRDPSALAKSHLPTMPEGIQRETLIALSKSGEYYECLNGHPILVSKCGQLKKATCTECGELLKKVTTEFDIKKEMAFMGHCLGRPESRSPLPSSMRHLSPAACSVVRAIMHSALVYVSCNSTTATEGLLEMVRVEGLRPTELPEFFWCHLETDVKDLAQAIGKNEEEAAIVLHLILRQILTSDHPKTASVKAISSLENAVMRNKWEDMFNARYIQGILENVNKEIRTAMDSILEDNEQEHDPLLYMVYEHESSASDESLEPFLWTYRSCVTLEHLSLLLQPQRDKYRILTEFLNQEPTLRATQYLPDIVKLQLQLQKCYHHRISVKEAQQRTIGDFFEERSLPKKLLTSLKVAWSIARDKLQNHGRVKVERRHLDRLAEISESTPLHYIIPTTSGPGACGLALVDFLVLQHNNFIEMCQGVVVGDDKSKLFWKEHKVPLQLVHCCHLLDYEPHLLSIVLSHCHYSLQVGKGQDVTYDLAALEKHILDRFIQGKPRIEMEIQQVAYAKDWYISANFSSVRMKVRQVELSSKAQQDILSDLVEIDQLCDSLDVVNILLGFLATGGGRADTRLDDYLRKLRMKSKPISKMAKQHCKLEHILSLWKTLSVGLGKKMMSRGQEPFDVDGSLLQDPIFPFSDDRARLDECLRYFPPEELERFLGTMCEFVESFLKHNISEKQDWPLPDVMEGFLEQNQLEVPPQLAELPKTILLPHTVALWKYIVDFQKNKHL